MKDISKFLKFWVLLVLLSLCVPVALSQNLMFVVTKIDSSYQVKESIFPQVLPLLIPKMDSVFNHFTSKDSFLGHYGSDKLGGRERWEPLDRIKAVSSCLIFPTLQVRKVRQDTTPAYMNDSMNMVLIEEYHFNDPKTAKHVCYYMRMVPCEKIFESPFLPDKKYTYFQHRNRAYVVISYNHLKEDETKLRYIIKCIHKVCRKEKRINFGKFEN